MKVNDRVRFVFACPTAPPAHKEYVGVTGTITEIWEYVPTIRSVWGKEINNPHGNVKVTLDERLYGDGWNCGVIHVFSWELEVI